MNIKIPSTFLEMMDWEDYTQFINTRLEKLFPAKMFLGSPVFTEIYEKVLLPNNILPRLVREYVEKIRRNPKSTVFKYAWRIAREAAVTHGGTARGYFDESLRIAWAKMR